MMQVCTRILLLVMAAAACLPFSVAYARQATRTPSAPVMRKMPVHVVDIYREPVEGIVLSSRGEGSQSDPTDNSGRTYVGLPVGAKTHVRVSLQLVRGVKGNEEWEWVASDQIAVPPSDSESESFITVMLIKKSDKQLLLQRNYLNTLNQKIESKQPTQSNTRQGQGPEFAVLAVEALREQERELELRKGEMADVILSYAQSLYSEGRYQESANRCRDALLIHPNSLRSLTLLALALTKGNSYAEAELAYERILRFSLVQGIKPSDSELNDLLSNYDNIFVMSPSEQLTILENYLFVLRQLNRLAKVEAIETRAKAIRVILTQQQQKNQAP